MFLDHEFIFFCGDVVHNEGLMLTYFFSKTRWQNGSLF